MHQHRASLLPRLLNKPDDFVEVGILGVEEQLRLRLRPRERKVADTLLLKGIIDFSAATVDDVGDLVGGNPFVVLH